MSFIDRLFGTQKTQSLALLEVGADSIGGAYILLSKDAPPQMLFSGRLAIEAHDGEPLEAAMERTFEALGASLIRDGAPALLRATGTGKADIVLCAVSAPWQQTTIRTEHIEAEKSFTFTHETLDNALAKEPAVGPDQLVVNEFPIGTILNGYETKDPYGKKVTDASIIILTSSIDKAVAEICAKTLRALFHTKDMALASGASVRYQALRFVFPHERDCLILDAEKNEVTISLVRHGLLAATKSVASGSDETWATSVQDALRTLAKDYPLPRTIFLIARANDRERFQTALQSTTSGSLWLSDVPPTVTPILDSHLSAYVKLVGETKPDLPLALLGLYAYRTFLEE